MLESLDLSTIVLAVASLGTAAYGVVDASKGFGGGISNRGFGDIRTVVSKLIPASSGASGNRLSDVASDVPAVVRHVRLQCVADSGRTTKRTRPSLP
jgi:hypothetical protein